MRLAFGIPILLTATLAVPTAQAQKSQGFSETTEVVAVEVPVQVIGKDGEPVRGLTADDFEVFEGRRKMPVTGFEVVDLEVPTTAARAAAVPAAARRHFLLLFDLSFSEPKSIVKAREAARNLVLGLHSSDLVAVASYHASTGPQLVLGFTSDRRQVDTALEQVGMDTGKPNDPLRLVMRRGTGRGRPVQAASPNVAGTVESQDYRAGSADTIAAYNDKLSNSMGSGDMESQKRDVTALTRSFADLAKVMGGVQGRKYVVYLSEGYDSRLLQGTTDQARVDEMSAASASGEMWNVDSEERYGSTKTANDVERMLEEFRRADCVIQAVDIGGLEAGAEVGKRRTGGKDSLLQMAKGTGGELYENLNDLSSAMDTVLKKTSVTYVLAFQPEKLKFDGSYHKLRVELKDAKGAHILHRPGYYAPKPFSERNPFERLLDASTRVMSGEEAGTLGISVLAAPFRVSSEGLAYVPVVIEIDGPGLIAGMQSGTSRSVPAEIYVYAFDAAGAIPDFVTQTLGLDLGKVEPTLRQSGLKFFGHLDLFPGTYSLRVLVRNGSTGAYGLRVASLTVPDPVEGDPVLLPAFFPEAPGKWLMAREVVPAGEKTPPYPFMVKDQPFIPASKPVLALGQPAAVSLMGYNLAPGNLEVRSEVLSADGKEVGSGAIQVLERETGGVDRLKGTFQPPALEPGEYLLRVTLTDADGGTGTSTTPFVIAKKTS
ncbi:MAG TPA: VWA domain-containing protein [Thermoanaerobaculia bacterium]|jgi:VWFA-related protein|nr:VWA domain-containing protein [Thermoanaerobaculia bacterium]